MVNLSLHTNTEKCLEWFLYNHKSVRRVIRLHMYGREFTQLINKPFQLTMKLLMYFRFLVRQTLRLYKPLLELHHLPLIQ